MTDERRVLMIASFPHLLDKVVDGAAMTTLSLVSSYPARGRNGTGLVLAGDNGGSPPPNAQQGTKP